MFLSCVSFIGSLVFSVCVCCCTFILVVLPYWHIKEYIVRQFLSSAFSRLLSEVLCLHVVCLCVRACMCPPCGLSPRLMKVLINLEGGNTATLFSCYAPTWLHHKRRRNSSTSSWVRLLKQCHSNRDCLFLGTSIPGLGVITDWHKIIGRHGIKIIGRHGIGWLLSM